MRLFNVNNLDIVYHHIPNLNSVVIMYGVKVGSRDEIKKNYGISHYIEHMLFKGTKKYSSKQITDSLYENGAELNAFTSRNMTGYYTKIDSKQLLKALEILTEMLFNSKLTKKDLEIEKNVVINENIKNRSNPTLICSNNLVELIYKNTTLEHSIGGIDNIIKKYSRKQVIDYMNTFYNLNNMCLIIIGNIEIEYNKINNYIKNLFIKLKPNSNIFYNERKLYPKFTNLQNDFRYKNIIMDIEESYINIGFPCDNLLDIKDYCIYQIISNILGGNMSSRLFQILREKNSLVYTISSNLYVDNEIGYINICFGTKSNNTRIMKCLKLIFKEIHKLTTKLLTEKELLFNKNYIIGSLKILNDDPLELVHLLVENLLQKKKIIDINTYINEFNKITAEDIINKSKIIFNKNRYNIVIISKKKLIKKNIYKLYNAIK